MGNVISLEEAVKRMVASLHIATGDAGVEYFDIREVFARGAINELDELFGDDGVVRTEHFTDLAVPYASQFGDFESKAFVDAHWDAIEEAMRQF